MLRNAINTHDKQYFNDDNWIINQTRFPNKAYSLKQTDIYKQLTAIREFRNRIVHHESIRFNATRTIDTEYAKERYELILTYIEYMGFDSASVLRMVEKPYSTLKVIDSMK